MTAAQETTAGVSYVATFWVRVFSWSMLTVLAVFLVNNYLAVTQDWPGISPVFQQGKAGLLAWIQAMAYIASLAAAVIYVQSTRSQTLRDRKSVV